MGQDRIGNFLGDDAVGHQLGQPLLKLLGPGCSIFAAESFPADLTGQLLLVVLVRNLLLAILAALIRHLRGLGILSVLVWHLGHLAVPVILSGHLSFSASSAPGGLHSCGCGLVHGIVFRQRREGDGTDDQGKGHQQCKCLLHDHIPPFIDCCFLRVFGRVVSPGTSYSAREP